MAQDTIHFKKITADSNLIAVAQVSLFPGVYLRGWHILKKDNNIEVMLPHKVYNDPITGEEKTWNMLKFDNEEICRHWLDRVKKEYIKWAQASHKNSVSSIEDNKNKG